MMKVGKRKRRLKRGERMGGRDFMGSCQSGGKVVVVDLGDGLVVVWVEGLGRRGWVDMVSRCDGRGFAGSRCYFYGDV